ncbi:MAG: hypothetical protein COC16_00230 [Lutibacter sp.]|nr:MAG: hypothetical protein COC16_00230 [Lutibacter sp.]
MNKNLVITSIIGALTIVLGAFGAHALQDTLSSSELKSFETAVRYQMYHVILLLLINMYPKFKNRTKNNLSYLFFLGMLFFSGSIYAITFGMNAKSIWFVTPLGGLFFILGWIYLAIIFIKKK